MDFARLDRYYEKLKKGLQEAEEAIQARVDSEKEENAEKTARLMFNELQKSMQLENNHKLLSEEIMFITTEILEMGMKSRIKDFVKENDTKDTVQ